MKLVDPVVPPISMAAELAPRLDSLDGKRIGLYANLKLNSAELLREVEAELRARYDIVGIVTGTYNPGRVMGSTEWGAIDSCDAVVLANGD
jgi:hypothetical protein